MDSRKIIRFGKSSSVITLPKDWLKKNSLDTGMSLYIHEDGEKLLLSSEKLLKKKSQKKIVIDVDRKEISTIKREIIGAYLNAYIVLELKGHDLSSKATEIKDTLHNLMALEVMEQTKDLIVAKDFLKIEDISFEDIFQRMHRIIQSMIKEALSSVEEDYYESLIEKDVDVNRLFFLIHRAVISALDDSYIMKKIDRTPIRLMNDWLLVNSLERIADEAKAISRMLRKIKLPKNELKTLQNLYKTIESDYNEVMEALFSKDKKKADQASDRGKKNIKACIEFYEKHPRQDIGPVIEKLKATQTHVRYIARIILNTE